MSLYFKLHVPPREAFLSIEPIPVIDLRTVKGESCDKVPTALSCRSIQVRNLSWMLKEDDLISTVDMTIVFDVTISLGIVKDGTMAERLFH